MSFKRARTMSFSSSQGSTVVGSSQGVNSLGANGGRSRMPRKSAGFKRSVKIGGKITASAVRRIAQMEIRRSQEVKTIDESATQQTIAQLNADASGHNTVTLAMTPAQGAGARQRIGDAISLDKVVINGTFYKQGVSGSAINLTHYLVSFRGNEPDIVIADVFDGNIALDSLNAGVQIYDVNVLRNPSYLQTIKIVSTWKTHIPVNVTLESGDDFPHATTQVVVDLKGVSKEFDGLSGAPSNLKYALITVADAGNRSGTLSTLNGVSTRLASTGITFNWGWRTFFRDA